ncbi:hypothetical protein C8J57DRAFT_1259082 [Mycena rebaudengoi]|nr:hypothetical protein C8J57DRAFT_1259082 [Mycena rebaudengoi]
MAPLAPPPGYNDSDSDEHEGGGGGDGGNGRERKGKHKATAGEMEEEERRRKRARREQHVAQEREAVLAKAAEADHAHAANEMLRARLAQRIAALEAAERRDGEDEEDEEDWRTEMPEGSVEDKPNDEMDSDVEEEEKKCDRCRDAGEVCVRQGGSKRRSKLVACNLCQSKHVHCSLIEVVLRPNKRQAERASRRARASGERASASEAPSNTPKKIRGTIKVKCHAPRVRQPPVDLEENAGPCPHTHTDEHFKQLGRRMDGLAEAIRRLEACEYCVHHTLRDLAAGHDVADDRRGMETGWKEDAEYFAAELEKIQAERDVARSSEEPEEQGEDDEEEWAPYHPEEYGSPLSAVPETTPEKEGRVKVKPEKEGEVEEERAVSLPPRAPLSEPEEVRVRPVKREPVELRVPKGESREIIVISDSEDEEAEAEKKNPRDRVRILRKKDDTKSMAGGRRAGDRRTPERL